MRNVNQTTHAWIAKSRATANLCCLPKDTVRKMTQPFTFNSRLNCVKCDYKLKENVTMLQQLKERHECYAWRKKQWGCIAQSIFCQPIKSFRSCFLLHRAKSNKRLSWTCTFQIWLGRSVNHVKQTDSSNVCGCWLREKSITLDS